LPLRWGVRARQSARLYRLAIVDPALSAVDLSEDKAGCTHLAFYKELCRLALSRDRTLWSAYIPARSAMFSVSAPWLVLGVSSSRTSFLPDIGSQVWQLRGS